jgi:MoxR-like ATPase
MPNHQTQEITEESGEPTGDNATFDLGAGMEIDLEVPELEDVGHPLVPDQNQDYMMREINGTQDLKLLSYVIDDPDFFAMLEGEAGVGKNMAVKTIASAANWPMVRVNFGVGTTYQNLVGRYAPVDNEDTTEEALERSEAVRKTAQRMFEENESMTMDKAVELASRSLPSGNSFQWQDGLLTMAVKHGWLFVADEINAADEEAIMPLNGVTEDRNSRYLTIEELSQVIDPHPNFRFVATRNPVSYAGVSEMNDALQSRSYVIEFNYHENEALEEILENNSDIIQNESEAALQSLVSLIQDIRRQEQSGNEIITRVSARDAIKICRLTDIMEIREAAKTVIMGIADPTDKDSLRELIETQRF